MASLGIPTTNGGARKHPAGAHAQGGVPSTEPQGCSGPPQSSVPRTSQVLQSPPRKYTAIRGLQAGQTRGHPAEQEPHPGILPKAGARSRNQGLPLGGSPGEHPASGSPRSRRLPPPAGSPPQRGVGGWERKTMQAWMPRGQADGLEPMRRRQQQAVVACHYRRYCRQPSNTTGPPQGHTSTRRGEMPTGGPAQEGGKHA